MEQGVAIVKGLQPFLQANPSAMREEARRESGKRRGRPKKLPEAVMLFLMAIHTLLPYRQLSGIVKGLFGESVHYTTIEKRIKREKSKWNTKPLACGGLLFFLTGIPAGKYFIDSTGFSQRRKGAWRPTKFKIKIKRKWWKLHILCDKNGKIVAFALTEGNVNDSKLFEDLVSILPPDSVVCGDKAYSSRKNYRIAREHGIILHSPPKENASERQKGCKVFADEVKLFRKLGYKAWARETGYSERFNKEFVFSKLKTMFGEELRATSIAGATISLL
ncbi:MAG: transposase, partial [Thermoplasmata archaeon]